ncbi:MAG: methyltransferase [Legionella sp.]
MHMSLTQNKDEVFTVDFYNNYCSLIASGAKLKLVEAMFNLNLFALFEHNKCVSEQAIIEKLGLMPNRAKKWLYLLSDAHFLIKVEIDNQPAYQLTNGFIKLRHSEQWSSMQFFFNTWHVAADENLTDVLRYGKVKTSVSWPPKTDVEVKWLEDWMTETADLPIHSLLKEINFKKVTSFLDVGGGDATMACALVTAHPHLKAAVYNLPKSAQLARNNIASKKLSDKVLVIEGDFISDNLFPKGFDLILFTRVFFDWDESINRKLLKMAYQALPQHGLVSICEFYKEENRDRCLSSEYRYIFHDDFAPHVMKTAAEYLTMLEETGFTMLSVQKQSPSSLCTVLLARK